MLSLMMLLATLLAPQAWSASSKDPGKALGAEVRVANAATEQNERDVDKAAQQSQDRSIRTLRALLKKYRGTSREPVFLAKLADLQQQSAAILFRIAHGNAHRADKPVDLGGYKLAMENTIATATELIRRYPHYEEIAHTYFVRAKSYEELEKVKPATEDYLFLVRSFPAAEEVIPSYMSLAEFAIQENDHPRAIRFLQEIEKHPEDVHYPFALYKLAWSYYNLKEIPASLSYAERNVAYYNSLERASPGSEASSDTALKENCLLDIPVFYFEGYEENLSPYPLEHALDYFKKLDHSPTLGKMLLRFAKLLRSHDHEADMVAWKNQVLASEPLRPEALDVVLTIYESQLNKRKYGELVDSARDIVKLYATGKSNGKSNENMPKAQKLLLDTADGLQSLIVKNKEADDVRTYSAELASIYQSFTEAVDEKDPRIPRVHYNLAETLFEIKDYSAATENYRWVVEHGKWDAQASSATDASLKAIAARYETLAGKKLIPGKLEAKPLPEKDPATPIDPLLSEWISWLETHLKHSAAGTENFIFESNRALYAQGRLHEALARLTRFARKHPESKYAIPSASLALDTWIASRDWEQALELANDFLEIAPWQSTEFSKRLLSVAADSSYKQMEAAFASKDYTTVLDRADGFLKRYSASERLADSLNLAGSAALLSGKKSKALAYYGRLIADLPPSDNTAKALMARGSSEEDSFRFGSAAADYRAYLALPASYISQDPAALEKLRGKTLMLSWLSGSSPDLSASLSSKSVCTESLSGECEKYSALAQLSSPSIDPEHGNAFEKARRAGPKTKAIWATIALEKAKDLAFRDRLLMLKILAQGWEELDPLMKFSLIPIISASVPRAFRLDRAAMGDVAPLKADARYITHRIDMIHEMENAAAQAVKLPWARIRAEVMSEIAGLYSDLSKGLASLPPSKGFSSSDLDAYEETIRKLTVPFDEKGNDIRAKAFEIASNSLIEEDSFNQLAGTFFEENPSLAKSLRLPDPPTAPKNASEKPRELDFALLVDLDTAAGSAWKDALNPRDLASSTEMGAEAEDGQATSARLRNLWARAVRGKRWAQVAFFLQIAQERKLLAPGSLSIARAVSFAQAGARAEGFAELEEAVKNFSDPDTKRRALLALLPFAVHSLSKKTAHNLIAEIDTKDMKPDQLALVRKLAVWADGK